MQVVARTSNRIFVGLPLCAQYTSLPISPETDVVSRPEPGILRPCNRLHHSHFYPGHDHQPPPKNSQAVRSPLDYFFWNIDGRRGARILGPLISTRKSTGRRAMRFLGSMLTERLEKEAELGSEWEGKPVRDSDKFAPFRAQRKKSERLGFLAPRDGRGVGTYSPSTCGARHGCKYGRYSYYFDGS